MTSLLCLSQPYWVVNGASQWTPPPTAPAAPPQPTYPAQPPPGQYDKPGAYPAQQPYAAQQVHPAPFQPGMGPPVAAGGAHMTPQFGVQPGGAPQMDPRASQWSSGLCSCFDDCGLCCKGWICPCLVYQDIVIKASPRLGQSGEKLMIWCAAAVIPGCCCGVPCCCIPEGQTRTEFRKLYGVPGDECQDFCVHTPCCHICALTQEMRHIMAFPLNGEIAVGLPRQ
jgi:Cys-rich protein (TIGR01571 family)